MGTPAARRAALAALALVALALAAHAILIAAPGFYANDEWQKFDHLRLHGWNDFLQAYGTLRPGPEFGYPVRPLGFILQGFAAQWMLSAPWAAHLVGVLLHALVALTFAWVLRRAGVGFATAVLAAALFVVSPLATPATGWLAASFDQLYVLFLLLAAAVLVGLPGEGMTPLRALGLLLATFAALLSKETAIVAPGGVLLVGYLMRSAQPEAFAWRPFALAFGIVSLPVLAYLLYRAPALAVSLAGQADPAYTPSVNHAPTNAWRFFAFPFRLKLVEMSAAVFRSPWQPLAAAAAHLLLVGAVYRWHGARFACGYVAAYFLFLLPVLPLPEPGAHCLYGAALAMSLALAATLARAWTARRFGWVALLLALVGALCTHSVAIQRHFHAVGACQSRLLADLDAALAQPAAESGVVIAGEDGVSLRIAIRAVSAREAYVTNGRPRIAFDPPDAWTAAAPDPHAVRLRMTPACTLRPDVAAGP